MFCFVFRFVDMAGFCHALVVYEIQKHVRTSEDIKSVVYSYFKFQRDY